MAAIRQYKDAATREATTDKVAAALIKEPDESTARLILRIQNSDGPWRMLADQVIADMGSDGEAAMFHPERVTEFRWRA